MAPPPLDAISDAVARILANADAEIASHHPVCRSSGKCCQFEKYGHRLYVTAAELAHFSRWAQNNAAPSPAPSSSPTAISLPQFFARQSPEGCPYQVEKRCTARDARPLGCRVYFCDQTAQSWQHDLYEKYHARLREVHDRHALPYRYLEWRSALRELLDTGDEGAAQ